MKELIPDGTRVQVIRRSGEVITGYTRRLTYLDHIGHYYKIMRDNPIEYCDYHTTGYGRKKKTVEYKTVNDDYGMYRDDLISIL